jgi:hypothetical protein
VGPSDSITDLLPDPEPKEPTPKVDEFLGAGILDKKPFTEEESDCNKDSVFFLFLSFSFFSSSSSSSSSKIEGLLMGGLN